jgi:hypothetical protein
MLVHEFQVNQQLPPTATRTSHQLEPSTNVKRESFSCCFAAVVVGWLLLMIN